MGTRSPFFNKDILNRDTGEGSVHTEEGQIMQLTRNFRFSEFVNTSYSQYAKENYDYGKANIDKVKALAVGAQRVRDIIKAPMIISSGVRCPSLNKAVKGAKNSQHVKCEAIDFILTDFGDPKYKDSRLWNAFKKIRTSAIEFDQLIYEVRGESEWIHISFCDDNRRECLTYDGKKYTRINPKEVL